MNGQSYLLETDGANAITVAYTASSGGAGGPLSQHTTGSAGRCFTTRRHRLDPALDTTAGSVSSTFIYDAFGNEQGSPLSCRRLCIWREGIVFQHRRCRLLRRRVGIICRQLGGGYQLSYSGTPVQPNIACHLSTYLLSQSPSQANHAHVASTT